MYPTPLVAPPSEDELLADLQAHVFDEEVSFETSDGCMVEADGTCGHGHPTWLVRYALI